jgi:transposase-like protein
VFSIVKTREREKARALRRDNALSVKAIARRLNVSQSSVSRWVRDIELRPEQVAHLRRRAYDGGIKGQTMNAAIRRSARMMAQEEGRALAREAPTLHLAGCMLYWAEGSRKRTQVAFVNSDPDMAKLFVRFLETYFPIDRCDIRITCNLFADHVQRQRDIERFWLETLDLPAACLLPSVVNVYSKYSKKKRVNRLPYGTCRIVVSRVRIAQHIYGAIQEYGGFRRDAWLE